MATRGGKNSTLFSSFVNAVVISVSYLYMSCLSQLTAYSMTNTLFSQTIEAQEEIDRGQPVSMPLTTIFGNEFSWSLKDAIEYSGSYDKIYRKSFGNVPDEDRGRNKVGVSIKNVAGGAQIHSFPGLYPTN